MDTQQIFLTQFGLSVSVVGLFAYWYLRPWLANKSREDALIPLVAPHAFRHIGLGFIVPGLVAPTLDPNFANAAAYGDFASGLLAIVTLFALRGQWRVAIPMVWVLNIVGTGDLMNALRQADTIPDLGVMRFVPTFIVPVLLVMHFMMFVRLLSPAKCANTAQDAASARTCTAA